MTSKIRRLPPSTRILPFLPSKTYPSLPTQSQTFVSSKRGILREVGDQSSVRWLLLGRSTLSNLQHISSKASLIMTSPIKGISMYLTSLPFQHEDLPSFDRVKLNKQGVALWNICANVRQTGQLLAQKELIRKGSTHRPKREPY